MDVAINGQEGVPLAELDMSGPVPDEIVVASGDKVIITEGDELAISVEGDDEAVSSLRFVRDGGMLGVTRESQSWGESGSAIIRVTMAAPRELVIMRQEDSSLISSPASSRKSVRDSSAILSTSSGVQNTMLPALDSRPHQRASNRVRAINGQVTTANR